MKPLGEQTNCAAPHVRAAEHVLEVLPAIMRGLRFEMRRRHHWPVSVAQFRALFLLSQFEGASLSQLAERMDLALPSMSKMIDLLIDRKLVNRRQHLEDRRKLALAITPRGAEILQTAKKTATEYVAAKLAGLSSDQCRTVIDAMSILQPAFWSCLTTQTETV